MAQPMNMQGPAVSRAATGLSETAVCPAGSTKPCALAARSIATADLRIVLCPG
eukprot:CAMPEP_0174698104 /NCGR_PEP_ID=MMETSP1094-20130205/3778_1 /TAXON_ID=156173 /ORGANISM="Chrysochromulina brevifilum, Strain UTEX LB 985" /LENGTH=52 /DNA_ID=CAMNT_0015895207 /DNA_START=493 /DNA_END=647 /DNA_ORIENTATION=+